MICYWPTYKRLGPLPIQLSMMQSPVKTWRQLRTEGLKEERDKAFNELRHYRGINAASATQAILDAADVSRLAMDYAQAVRDGDPVAKVEKRYDAVAETLTQDVDLLYDALTVPRR